jgi:ABC-2 type transporter
MALGILCGYLMGLAISAAVPNQNSALILLIAVVVPQLLFAGVLIPLNSIPAGDTISHVISTRWTFEAFLRIPGTGDALTHDACMALPSDQRDKLTDQQKSTCPCMGVNIYTSCATIPGILSPDRWNAQSQAAMARPEPIRPLEPTLLPSPTPLATPTSIPLPSNPAQLPQYQAALQAQMAQYMKGQIGQAGAYTQAVQDQYKDYITRVGTYTTDEQDWQTQRQATIGSAERQLERIMDLYGPAFSGTVATRWWNLAAIVAGLLILIFVFQKLKDIVR